MHIENSDWPRITRRILDLHNAVFPAENIYEHYTQAEVCLSNCGTASQDMYLKASQKPRREHWICEMVEMASASATASQSTCHKSG